VVVALNLIDEAERHGLKVDERHLMRELGVPVVPMVARRMQGVPELLQAVEDVIQGRFETHPHRIKQHDAKLEAVIGQMVTALETQFPGLPNARWVALRLLDGDASIEEAVKNRSLGDLTRGTVTAPPREANADGLISLEAIAS
jgi:ferrous iron transport protein B